MSDTSKSRIEKTRLQMGILIFFILDILTVSCLNFDVNNVKTISLNGQSTVNKSTYFGYTLLLQKGSSPIVIVGAPKHDTESGGALFACDALNGGGCDKYNISTSNTGTKNGNFLGAALDGDENRGQSFIVCAPRKMSPRGFLAKTQYDLRGLCVYQRNSSILNDIITNLEPLAGRAPVRQRFYDSAFGQAGIDVHYVKDSNWALLGAPGIKNWNGAIVSQSLTKTDVSTIIPSNSDIFDRMDLMGYTVTSIKTSNGLHNIAGAPRASNLLGRVVMYKGMDEISNFHGVEVGSYFGSSILAQDVDGDNVEDLFIGAPMGKGSTFEEGYVYFYKNALRTTISLSLVGSKKPGARFGTSMAALGDIDLDSFKDIAISAPFEDDGTGAVYIYKGSVNGIESTFSQRLSPKQFDGNFVNVKGFGLGLSKGNDVDGNGHNDLAIGAYKSEQVFILRTKSVIDYRMSLDANVTILKINAANNIAVRCCVYYRQRSSDIDLPLVHFNLTLSLDYRVRGQRIRRMTIPALMWKSTCVTIDVMTESSPALSPFSMSLISQVPEDIFGVGENKIEKSIVFSHGCGEDEVCQTRITLNLEPDKENLVLGLDKQIYVSLDVKNEGEPGYQCQLHMQVPDEVDFRRKQECNADNSTYLVCPFSTTLMSEKKVRLEFDINSDHLFTDNIEIGFDVKCTGENLEPNSAKTLRIGIELQNSPYIEGKSETPNVYYNEETEGIEMSHSFAVGNSGPSPLKLDIHLLLPMVQTDGIDIFELVDTKATSPGVQFVCKPDDQTKTFSNIQSLKSQLPISLLPNETVVLDCLQEGSKCLEIICRGEFLYKSELAKIAVTVKARTKLLEAHFRSELQAKDAIGYLIVGFIPNTKRIQSSSVSLLISSQQTKPIPVWVWILAAILGVMVLFALIYLLYKCHFFDRNYRDRMNDEKLMDDEIEERGESSKVMYLYDNMEETPEENPEEASAEPSH